MPYSIISSLIFILMISLSELCYAAHPTQPRMLLLKNQPGLSVKSFLNENYDPFHQRNLLQPCNDGWSVTPFKVSHPFQRDSTTTTRNVVLLLVVNSLRGGGRPPPRATQGRKKIPSIETVQHFIRVIGLMYIALYKAMTVFGPLNFIRVVNIGVFGLWTVSFILMMLKYMAANSGILHDMKELRQLFPKGRVISIKQGERVTIPEGYILIFCDNGWSDPNMNQKVFDTETSSMDRKELFLVHRKRDKIRLFFVNEVDYSDYIHEIVQTRNGLFDFFQSLLVKENGPDLKLQSDCIDIFMNDDPSFTFPGNSVLVAMEHEIPDSMYDSNITRYRRRKMISQVRNEPTSLYFTSENNFMSAYRLFQRKHSIQNDPLRGILYQHFISPNPLQELLTRPLSVFCSAFSHKTMDHLLSNLAALHVVGPPVLNALGASAFTHLYLVCALASTMAQCAWSEFSSKVLKRKDDNVIGSLGASGAISGILGWYYLSSSSKYAYVMVGRNKLKPLTVFLVYILVDACGLLGLVGLADVIEKTVLSEGKSFGHVISWVVDGDNYKKVRGESEKNISFSGHLGGYIGSIVYYLLVTKTRNRYSW
jgi:membrane associated rhomboid family serine protease